MKESKQEGPVKGKLLNVAKAAEYLNCGKSWIYNHMASNTLPFPYYPMGFGRRFDSADLDDYLRKKKMQAGVGPEGGFM